MEQLTEDIVKLEFAVGDNFSFDLDSEFHLISSHLKLNERECLKADFSSFIEKGRFAVINSFCGGILFLKVPELIEKIRINWRTDSQDFQASVIYKSDKRRPENIKYKPSAGKIESVVWPREVIFPNFHEYPKGIQKALLAVIGTVVKGICEYSRTTIAHMKIENEFEIELLRDNEYELKLKVELK